MGTFHGAQARRHLPSLTALQFFEAAARHLSFTRAAAELCVTQSAISRQVKQLEGYLEQRLFHRSQNKLVLTPAGSQYASAVHALLDQAEAATYASMNFADGRNVLKIASLPTFGSRWLVPRLSEFVELYPAIELDIRTCIAPFDFGATDADLAFHFGNDGWQGATSHRLMGETLVAVCAPSLIGQREALADTAAVANYPLLQHATRPFAWVEWFSQAKVVTAHALNGPRFDHFYMTIQAAVGGLGIALLPRFLVIDEFASGRLIVAANHEHHTSAAYWLVYPESKSHLHPVCAFRDWMLGKVNEDGRSIVDWGSQDPVQREE